MTCSITTLFFQARRGTASSLPTHIQVYGAAQGCPGDQVIIEVVINPTLTLTSPPVNVDPAGNFSCDLPLTGVPCNAKVQVTARCATNSACYKTVSGSLDCYGCYGADVSVTYAASCTGTPPKKQVTFDAQIAIPGTSQNFRWDFGDGTPLGTVFTILNPPPGTSATTHPHIETHDYAAGGPYFATLKVDPSIESCVELKVEVKVSCTSALCPTVTPAQVQVANDCVNGKKTVTLGASVVTPAGPSAVAVYWDFGDGSFGPPQNLAPGSTVSVTATHDYAPGPYTATLKVFLPSGCLDSPMPFTVGPCPVCDLSIVRIDTTVGDCDPVTGMRTVTATAVLNNNDPSDLYYWQWDVNPATVGLPAATGTTQHHEYPAPGSSPVSVTVALTVTRGGTCVSTLSKPLTFAGCGGECPDITSLVLDLPGTCTADRQRRIVTLDATVVGSGATTYTWDCGDGTILTIPGSAGPQTTHEFAPGSYRVQLTADGPGDCSTTLSLQITVTPCCPVVTGLTATPGNCNEGATARPVTLTAQVSGTGATGYQWTFGDGTPDVTTSLPESPPHDYTPPGPFTATVRATAPNCPDSSASTTITNVAPCPPPVPPPPPPPKTSVSCAVLLWIAIFMILIGALVSVIGCILSHVFPQGGLIVGIIGVILFVIGWLLFGLWLLICAAVTACAVILAVRRLVMVLIFVFAAIAAILGIIALSGTPFLWPCAGAAAIYGLNWGALLAILDWVAQWRGCLILNPSGASGASGASSSASGLTSTQPSRMGMGSTAAWTNDAVMQLQDATERGSLEARGEATRPSGLGDVIKSATSAMGIAPCSGCQERARRLNQWVPFPGAHSGGPTQDPTPEPSPSG